jgi:hypothetical protein
MANERLPEPKTEAKPAKRRQTSRYTEEEIDRGLVEVALCGGNTRHAHRRLKEQGITISRPTLERWANRERVGQYEALRAELVPRIHAAIAVQCEDSAHLAGEIEREMLEKFREDFHKLDPRDQAGSIRNIGTTRAISIDKAALLRGRPTEIRKELKDPGQGLRELAELFPGVLTLPSIDSTAEELPAPALPESHE